ncbi:MAG: glycerol-3-phosphate 1-O-acyltransferase PlsY [candidate division WOR-3 bacterium]|nr:MAG: glycerol-3-phosphate 1-O-acyltransferase PlsY [candidate division WOR-3 bacterium]
MMVNYFLSFIIGLFFGMMPFSYMLGLLRGVDLRKVGSGNIGATNLGRNLGPLFFVLGFLLDAFKGVIPVLLSQSLLDSGTLAGAGAILGHIFNPFFGFRGGKGVATTIGVAATLALKSFALSIGIWLLIYLTTLLVSLASLSFAVALPLFSFIMNEGTIGDRLLFILISIMVFYAHRHNIQRLLNRSEPKTVLWRKK